jgi:hypothetical protein
MFSSALRVHECCAACRRPVGRCSCGRVRETYDGVLLRGEWQEVSRRQPEAEAQELELAVS